MTRPVTWKEKEMKLQQEEVVTVESLLHCHQQIQNETVKLDNCIARIVEDVGAAPQESIARACQVAARLKMSLDSLDAALQTLKPVIAADMSEQEIIKMVALQYAREEWSDVDEKCTIWTVTSHVEWEVRFSVTYDQATVTVKKTDQGYEVINVEWYFGIA